MFMEYEYFGSLAELTWSPKAYIPKIEFIS